MGSAARGVLNRLFLDGRKSRCRVGVPQPDSLRARDYSEFLLGCKPSGSSKRRTNVPATCCLLPKAVQADVRQSSDQCGHGVHGGFFRSAWCSRCSRLRWKKVRDPENYTSKQVGSQPGHEIPKGGLMRSGALCRRRFDVSSRLRRQQESGPPLAGGLFLTHYCATAFLRS